MIRKIRFFIQKNMPRFYLNLVKINCFFRKIQSGERKRSFGKLNGDKNIYVIRVRRESLGLMGYYMAILGHLRIAEKRNYIPVVDMMNYKNQYLCSDKMGVVNSWEYYFKQTNPIISLEEAYKSKNVVLSNMETPMEANPRMFYEQIYLNGHMEEYYKKIKKHFHFQPEIEKILKNNYDNIFGPIVAKGKKILGVVCRGTDIIGFPGHSIQASKEELLDIVKELMEKYQCDYVFMASDTDKAIRFFEQHMGKTVVLTNDAKRYDDFSEKHANVLSEMHFERENDEYLKGMEYLTTIYLLSKCNVLVGSLVGSTIGAICMNCGAYEHVQIIDKGVY